MAALDDLLQKVSDPVLRDRLAKEIHKVTKHKKFGLVFEEHLPECTPLYDVPIRKGSRVAVRDTEIKETFTVLSVKDEMVKCISNNDKEQHEFPLDDLVTVAEFGEPIYPYLQTIDTVCNAPDSDLWHTLIEADNYHALQLLEYMYAGKVDCIYIDPPYNKEDSKDWKYNCNYVDGKDMYRHSKWLSMMERRLKLAKKLLNPKDSVLIVTIDELEYLHLGMLLEQMFPEAKIQMISSRINATGIIRQNEFTRVDEYIFFVMFGCSAPQMSSVGPVVSEEVKPISWHGLWRRDIESRRGTKKGGVAQFYPIYVNDTTCTIQKIGEPLAPGVDRHTVKEEDGCTTVFPLRPDGTEMNWGLIGSVLEDRIKKGYVRVKRKRGKRKEYTIEYLTSGYIADIESGKASVEGYNDDGSIIAFYVSGATKTQIPTQWNEKSHYSKENGTSLTKKMLLSRKFPYPKSLYAVHDCISYFVANKPNAVILDFFAGSGTTLHAVNLLNQETHGSRRCILVTNNEIGYKTEQKLKADGYRPGDDEWEAVGIARYATWPRTVCSIEGHDINGVPLKGKYIGNKAPMSDGFEANAIYFKLGFLDKNAVALGRQFKELLGVLWMKAGAIGPCPHLARNATVPDMMILPQNRMAILIDDTAFASFEEQVKKHPEIETVYIVTDSDRGYREMMHALGIRNTYQLYRNYLDNFRINHRR